MQLKSKLNNKIDLGLWSLLNLYLFKCFSQNSKRRHNYILVAFKKLNKYLDYLRIIKTLQEYHKMKKIVFNKTQRNIFSAFYLKNINEENVRNWENHESKKQDQFEYFEIYKSYVKGQSKKNKKVYGKLLDNFDDNLKVIFENMQIGK